MGLGGIAGIADFPERRTADNGLANAHDNTPLTQVPQQNLHAAARDDHVVSRSVFRVPFWRDEVGAAVFRNDYISIAGAQDGLAKDRERIQVL